MKRPNSGYHNKSCLNKIKIHVFINRKISIFGKEKKLTLERLI